jgi:hypothetical protein
MATFYLLPPRHFLGRCFAGYLQSVFPGRQWTSRTWPDLADTLATATQAHDDVYVVYREELPDGEGVERALADGFGAEAGDEVIELHAAGRPDQLAVRRWRVGAAA